MSGTSADGVDVALLETDGCDEIRFLAGMTLPYPESFRAALIELARPHSSLGDVLALEEQLTQFHGRAVGELLTQHCSVADSVRVIGFHGHTIRHEPRQRRTWQLGNASLLAELTRIAVVADFRRRDLAAGGEGAPLAPLYHQALLSDEPTPYVVLNLGGIANITWVGDSGAIVAGDTGPGCGLLDDLSRRTLDLPYDRDGMVACKGGVDEAVVRTALAAPYFARPLPKSADRFDFEHIDVTELAAADAAATLCAITAEAVTRAIRSLPAPPQRVYVTGGGVHHPVLMRELAVRLDEVSSGADRGLRPDSMEAECFAWLAVRHLRRLPMTLPTTTGCKNPTCGGVYVPGPPPGRPPSIP